MSNIRSFSDAKRKKMTEKKSEDVESRLKDLEKKMELIQDIVEANRARLHKMERVMRNILKGLGKNRMGT